MYKTKQKKKFFTFEFVVMVGSVTNGLCQFWQYVCVYQCVNVHLETQTDNTQTCPHIHTHTENNGWKKSVKATSSDSQGNTTRPLVLHVANWIVAISSHAGVAS